MFRCFEQLRYQEAGEEEVADVVGCEVHLDSVFVERAFGKVHHGCIVYNDVDGWDIIPR